MLQFILLVCHVRAKKKHRKHYLAALRHADGEAEGWTEAGAEVYSSQEMRHLAQNQYLPWTSSVMKIPHNRYPVCGEAGSQPAHPSVVEGGVNKGIACTFCTEGGVGGAVCLLCRERWTQLRTRTTCLPERAEDGRQASAALVCLCLLEPQTCCLSVWKHTQGGRRSGVMEGRALYTFKVTVNKCLWSTKKRERERPHVQKE